MSPASPSPQHHAPTLRAATHHACPQVVRALHRCFLFDTGAGGAPRFLDEPRFQRLLPPLVAHLGLRPPAGLAAALELDARTGEQAGGSGQRGIGSHQLLMSCPLPAADALWLRTPIVLTSAFCVGLLLPLQTAPPAWRHPCSWAAAARARVRAPATLLS